MIMSNIVREATKQDLFYYKALIEKYLTTCQGENMPSFANIIEQDLFADDSQNILTLISLYYYALEPDFRLAAIPAKQELDFYTDNFLNAQDAWNHFQQKDIKSIADSYMDLESFISEVLSQYPDSEYYFPNDYDFSELDAYYESLMLK